MVCGGSLCGSNTLCASPCYARCTSPALRSGRGEKLRQRATFGDMEQYWAMSGNVWRHGAILSNVRRHLATWSNIGQCRATLGDLAALGVRLHTWTWADCRPTLAGVTRFRPGRFGPPVMCTGPWLAISRAVAAGAVGRVVFSVVFCSVSRLWAVAAGAVGPVVFSVVFCSVSRLWAVAAGAVGREIGRAHV